MYFKRIISILVIAALLVIPLSSCTKKVDNSVGVKPGEAQNPAPPASQPAEPAKNLPLCPLSGTPIEDEKAVGLRPIAVMLDNEYSARPQSGLYNADIVFEMPAEGNITRYMAIFHHLDTEKIGPVRSARPYFIDKALEFGAVYVHCGGSPQALKDLVTLKVDTLNDLKGSPCFWRAKDRKMPHNLYTSTKLMRSVMANKGMENKAATEYFKFFDSYTELENGTKAYHIDISYDKKYKVGYEYDENEKLYYRTINGARLKDHDNGKEIKAVNIIIEKTKAKVLDEKLRLEVGTVGSGSGYFISGGKMIEIKWSKADRRSRTIYTDSNGKEITLNKGVTWIQVVPDYNRIEIKE